MKENQTDSVNEEGTCRHLSCVWRWLWNQHPEPHQCRECSTHILWIEIYLPNRIHIASRHKIININYLFVSVFLWEQQGHDPKHSLFQCGAASVRY